MFSWADDSSVRAAAQAAPTPAARPGTHGRPRTFQRPLKRHFEYSVVLQNIRPWYGGHWFATVMHAYPYGEEALRLQAAQLFDAQEEFVGFEETPPRVGGSSVFAHMFTILRSVVECSGASGFCHCRADRLTMRELDKQRGSIIGIGQVEARA